MVSFPPRTAFKIKVVKGNVSEGKAVPLQACRVLECSRRLRLPDFKTIGT